MNEKVVSNRIEQVNLYNTQCIKLNLKGVLSEKVAVEFCKEWKELFNSSKIRKYNVIFNAKELIDYEPMARTVFQNLMKELYDQIENIWLVTDSKVISIGASIMKIFTSVSIKVVSSEDEIVF